MKLSPVDVEILVATYNGGKYITEQLDSLLCQNTSLMYRILISDDGSSDETIENINHFLKKVETHETEIILLSDETKNRGAICRFEYLLHHSSAQYVMFCDQDDVWDSDKMQITWDKMKASELLYPEVPIVVYTDLEIVDKNLRTLYASMRRYRGAKKRPMIRSLLVNNVVTGCTMMINRKAIDLSLPFPEGIYMHDWWLSLLASACGRMVYIDQSTVKYRQHDDNALGAGVDSGTVVGKLHKFFKNPRDDNIARLYRANFLQASELYKRSINNSNVDRRSLKQIELFLSGRERTGLSLKLFLLQHGFMPPSIIKKLSVLLRVH